MRTIEDAISRIPKFEDDYPDISKDYEKILNQCRFVALPIISKNEIIELLDSNFLKVFDLMKLNEFYDIWEKIKAKLVTMLQYEDRDVFKKQLREALMRNNEHITSKKIIIGEDNVEPSIGSWIRDYNISLGLKTVDRVKQAQYLSSSKNIKNVSPEEKKKLILLFKLYEKLKLSSFKPEGLEEKVSARIDDKPMVFSEGRLEKDYSADIVKTFDNMIKKGAFPGLKSVSDIDPAYGEMISKTERNQKDTAVKQDLKRDIKKELAQKLKLAPQDEKLLQEQVSKISQKTNKEYKKLQSFLLEQINPPKPTQKPDKFEVLAVLEILAMQGKLDDILDENKFQDILVNYFKSKSKTNLLEGFKLFPKAPEYFNHLLQFILREKLLLGINESAFWGIRFVKLMKKAGKNKYSKIIYYDAKRKSFAWQK